MNPTTLLIAVAALAYLGYYYYMLVATMRFNGRRIWLLPLLAGFFAYRNVPGDLLTNQHEQLITVILVALGAAIGIFQGFSITIFRDAQGVLRQRGSWKAAVILLLTIPLRIALEYFVLGMPTIGRGVTGDALRDTLFPYVAMLFVVVTGRAVTMLLRYPMILDSFLGSSKPPRVPQG